MLVQDQILTFLKASGPTLPTRVAKNIKTEVLIASAHLADLVSQGKIRISYLKIGASPLYYLPGQESSLYNFASGNMNSKDLAVLERLKFNKVLRENDLDLLPKVALRSLKDFAIPLHVRYQGKTELFWKWYLSSEEETKSIIQDLLKPVDELPIKTQDAVLEETPIEPPIEPPIESAEEAPQPMEEALTTESEPIALAEKSETFLESEVTGIEDSIDANFDSMILPELIPKSKDLPKQRKKKTIKKDKAKDSNNQVKNNEISDGPTIPKDQKAGKKNDVPEKAEEQQRLSEGPKTKIKSPRKKAPDEFFIFIEEYLSNIDVSIKKKDTIRKNAELNLLVDVSSIVGTTTYFCKAKKKSKCDEKDLSAAYMEAQIKKLPLLFLYTNEITKKAQDMLRTGAFENAILKKVEREDGIKV